MSVSDDFIKKEQLGEGKNKFLLIARFLWSLPIIRFLLPVCLVLSTLAALAPAIFRWYLAKLTECDQSICRELTFPYFYLSIPLNRNGLVIITIGSMLLRVFSWVLFEVPGQISARSIHKKMMNALIKVRSTYYDEHPSGILLNKLLGDFESARSSAIIWIGDVFNASLELIFCCGLVLLISPWLLLTVPVLLIVYFGIQGKVAYVLSRLRELGAHAKGRLLHRQNDLIDGAEVFSLYGKNAMLFERLALANRELLSVQILRSRIEAWGSFWTGLAGEFFAFIAMFALAGSVAFGAIDVAVGGTVISALLGVTGTLYWLSFAVSNVTVDLVHVRRVFEIIDLPSEEDEEKNISEYVGISTVPKKTSQDVEFVNYTMSYRAKSPLIIKNFSAKLPRGMKIGIVGKSGSGKTSLMQALLRMVYVHSGDILLGGESIFKYDITKYRSLFGVIPQTPWLFSGTIRENIDRQKNLTDERLNFLLQEAQLSFRLSDLVEEGGRNLSPGERQLLALVRVLAADKPYLLFDEPTSSLDPHTDVRVSALLKKYAEDKTVIIIAHRLETLRECGCLIDLSDG